MICWRQSPTIERVFSWQESVGRIGAEPAGAKDLLEKRRPGDRRFLNSAEKTARDLLTRFSEISQGKSMLSPSQT